MLYKIVVGHRTVLHWQLTDTPTPQLLPASLGRGQQSVPPAVGLDRFWVMETEGEVLEGLFILVDHEGHPLHALLVHFGCFPRHHGQVFGCRYLRKRSKLQTLKFYKTKEQIPGTYSGNITYNTRYRTKSFSLTLLFMYMLVLRHFRLTQISCIEKITDIVNWFTVKVRM